MKYPNNDQSTAKYPLYHCIVCPKYDWLSIISWLVGNYFILFKHIATYLLILYMPAEPTALHTYNLNSPCL